MFQILVVVMVLHQVTIQIKIKIKAKIKVSQRGKGENTKACTSDSQTCPCKKCQYIRKLENELTRFQGACRFTT